jgi:ribosome-associated protein
VQLRFDLSKSSLSDEIKARLARDRRLKTDDRGRADRRRARVPNSGAEREAARARLEHLVQQAMVRPKKRRATKATKASRERRLEGKKRKSATKRLRQRRQRRLAAARWRRTKKKKAGALRLRPFVS